MGYYEDFDAECEIINAQQRAEVHGLDPGLDLCPCKCHEDGESYCGNCFEDHVVPGLHEVREID